MRILQLLARVVLWPLIVLYVLCWLLVALVFGYDIWSDEEDA